MNSFGSQTTVSQRRSYRFGLLVMVLAIGVMLWIFVNNRESLSALQIAPGRLLLHTGLVGGVFAVFVYGWVLATRSVGCTVGARKVCSAWLLSNAGKYIPGKVMMLGARVAIMQRAGSRSAEAVMALSYEHLALLLAALPFTAYGILAGAQAPSTWSLGTLFLVTIVSLAFILRPLMLIDLINLLLTRWGRMPLARVMDRRLFAAAVGAFVLAWALYGLAGIVLLHSVGLAGHMPAYTVAAVSVAAWMIGFASLITPGGMGVREAVFAGYLSQYIQPAQAVACALLFRLTWTMVEWAGVAIGAGLGWLSVRDEKRI